MLCRMFSFLVLSLPLLVLPGCGGSGRPTLVKATGKVTLDGQPLEGAQIAFQLVTDGKAAYQRPSRAITNAAGEFTLTTYGNGDGAPLGKYRVGILKKEIVGKVPENFNSENEAATNLTYKWITPRSVSDPGSSGLEAEITSSGLKPAVFDLKAADKPEIEKSGPQVRANEP